MFPRSGLLQAGDSGDAVHMLQLMLNRAAGRYINLLPVAVTGIYDADTVQAVDAFQTCCLLETERGKTDKRTWNRLVRLYQLIWKKTFRRQSEGFLFRASRPFTGGYNLSP